MWLWGGDGVAFDVADGDFVFGDLVEVDDDAVFVVSAKCAHDVGLPLVLYVHFVVGDGWQVGEFGVVE